MVHEMVSLLFMFQSSRSVTVICNRMEWDQDMSTSCRAMDADLPQQASLILNWSATVGFVCG